MSKPKFDFVKLAPFIEPLAIVGAVSFAYWKLTSGGGQTPSDVKSEGLTIVNGNFKRPLAAYQSVAENSYREMNGSLSADDKMLLDLVRGMNGDELRQVYKDFGKRAGMIGIPLVSSIKIGSEKDIIGWYANTLSNNMLQGRHLDEMKKIWKPSGLWT